VFDDTSNIDPDLFLLVDTVNSSSERHDDGLGITLTVHGLTISGRVIPGWQWLEDAEELCRGGGDHHWVDFFTDARRSAGRGNAESNGDRAIVHLRDTRFFPLGGLTPVPAMEKSGFHWRGKIADVSGWTPGVLTVGGDAVDENAA
jgi:hypothetical protein